MLTILFAVFSLSTTPAQAGKLFKYVDKEGTMHVVDSEAAIPEEYREKTEVKETQSPVVEAKAAPEEEESSGGGMKRAVSGMKKGRHR